MKLAGKRIAILAENMYQEMELWVPYYRLREEGAEVKVVGAGGAKSYTSKHGYPVSVDVQAEQVKAVEFDELGRTPRNRGSTAVPVSGDLPRRPRRRWACRVDRNRTPDVLELCAVSTDILKACVPQSGTPRLGDHRRPYSVVGFGVPPLLDEDARTLPVAAAASGARSYSVYAPEAESSTRSPTRRLGSDEWSRAGRCTCAQRLRPCVRKKRTISAEVSGPAGSV